MSKGSSKNAEYDLILKEISSKITKLSPEETEIFFKAFFTPSELFEFCNRYLIVKSLIEQKPQRQISADLGVSLSKIAAGSRELKFGHGQDIFEKFFDK